MTKSSSNSDAPPPLRPGGKRGPERIEDAAANAVAQLPLVTVTNCEGAGASTARGQSHADEQPTPGAAGGMQAPQDAVFSQADTRHADGNAHGYAHAADAHAGTHDDPADLLCAHAAEDAHTDAHADPIRRRRPSVQEKGPSLTLS